jgi:iron complex transport system substrate-binding protein
MSDTTTPRSSRRGRGPRWALALVALALLAATAACGDDDDAGGSTTDEPAEGATDDGSFPVTVEHAFGETTIEEAPERIVSVGYTEQDTLLALGITPVAVTDWYGDQPFATWPWAQDELGDAEPEVLSLADGFQYERIAALEPDLIVGVNAGIDEGVYDQLSAIAPTIAHPEGAEAYFSRWDDQARLIGEAVGKADEVEALIEDVESQFAEAAAAHPEFDGTSIVFLQNAFYDGEAIAYPDGLSTAFLTDLGFTIPSELAPFDSDAEGAQAFIPLEQLPVLDVADVLLWATEKPEDRTNLEKEAVYTNLEEVRDGRLVFTDGVTAGAIYFTSLLSLPFVLEHLVPALASTLAGEGPATIDVAAAS